MHISSYRNMEDFSNRYLDTKAKLTIVDIGSQDISNRECSSYKPIFDKPNWKYIGCDLISGNNVDIVLSDIYHWKELKSDSVDIVISGQAFEHIEFFWVTMQEIARVLKKDGICCIIAPSSGHRHRFPLDCWRYYEDGFSALAKFAYLEVLEVQTQRNRYDSVSYDPDWQDSILVCKKPRNGFFMEIRAHIRYKMSHFLVKDISEINREMPIVLQAQLFYATEKGCYSESNSIKERVEVVDGNYCVVFDFEQITILPIVSIRFDPATQPIKLKILEAILVNKDSTAHEMQISNTNAETTNNQYYEFTHSDPIIKFVNSAIDYCQIDYIKIQGQVQMP